MQVYKKGIDLYKEKNSNANGIGHFFKFCNLLSWIRILWSVFTGKCPSGSLDLKYTEDVETEIDTSTAFRNVKAPLYEGAYNKYKSASRHHRNTFIQV
jgi:hypothetical protein